MVVVGEEGKVISLFRAFRVLFYDAGNESSETRREKGPQLKRSKAVQ